MIEGGEVATLGL